MDTEVQFADTLKKYVKASKYSLGQLSQLSGIPKTTIANWIQGRVKRPRTLDDLLKIAAALHLNESETSILLQAGAYPSLDEIVMHRETIDVDDLLAPWANAIKKRQQSAPFQALPNVPYFVGRDREIQALKKTLLEAETTALCTIQGMAGIGKTALALHVAYQLRPCFPDGVLWAGVNVTDPMLILSAFANAYGHNVSHYTDLGSRSQVVRGILAHKRALIIFDDVQDSDELEYLLPPTGTCAVIVTTRNNHLSMIIGSRRFQIKELSKQSGDALRLFTKIVGEAQVKKEKKTFEEIADLLGHLPLALVIVASRLAYEPGWLASDFLARLCATKKTLDELVYDNKDVRLSFDLSYGTLSSRQQAFFTMLGIFGGEDFSVEAAAYVAQVPGHEVHDIIRDLYSLSFIQQSHQQRYRLHPLLQSYAQEKLQGREYKDRMIDYFVEFAVEFQTNIRTVEIESSNIEYALKSAYECQKHTAFCQGVIAYYRFLNAKGLFTVADEYLKKAKQVAARGNDRQRLAVSLHYLGQIRDKFGDFAQAGDYLQEALQLAQQIESSAIMSGILTNLGVLSAKQGDLNKAEIYWQQALANAYQDDKYENVCAILSNLGSVAIMRGNFTKAKAYFEEGLAVAAQWGHAFHATYLSVNLGNLMQKQGDYDQAKDLYEKALTQAQERGYISIISSILSHLGEIAQNLGNYEQAKEFYWEGLKLAQECQINDTISQLLAGLGEVLGLSGESEQATACLSSGLEQAREIRNEVDICTILNKWGQFQLNLQQIDLAYEAFSESLTIAVAAGFQELVAMASFGLAQAEFKKGNLADAYHKGYQSLSLLTAMGHKDSEKVAEWLETRGFQEQVSDPPIKAVNMNFK